MAIVFFGSPDFAVTILEALVHAGVHVSAVVTQPDKPAGRGNQLKPPAVKAFALARGMACYQPVKVRDGGLAQWLREQQPDLAVVAAYGRILTQEVLDVPRLGCVNVHASLLPRWRGASPIARAIAAGDKQAGVCLMQMDAGLDTGPELARAALPISDDDTTPVLQTKLAALGGQLLVQHWAQLLGGELVARPQPTEGITWAPPIEKAEGQLQLALPAVALHAQVRAMQPWPGAILRTVLGEDWKIGAQGLQVRQGQGRVGTIAGIDRERVWLQCGVDQVGVAWLQRPNKTAAPAPDVLRGVRLDPAASLVGDG